MAANRYNGPLDDLDLSDLTGGSTPSGNNQPAPQQPAPPAPPAQQQPAQDHDPFRGNNNQNDGRRERGWGKWFIGGFLAVAFLVGMIFWGVPAIQSHLGSSSDPNSSQGSTPTNSPAPSSNGDQSGANDGNGSDNDGSQGGSKLSVAEQAAQLDPWFRGIPESNWETKTTAELGVDPTTPLGSFAKNFCVVLSDGTVIARGTSETGDSIPTIISDYTVPSEWNGTAVVLAEDDFNTVLLTSKLPENTNQELTGTIWHFEAAEGAYAYAGKGHTTPPAE